VRPDCTASVAKSRLRSARPSEQQPSRSRFRYRDAPKQATQNTVAKKRVRQEDVHSDYLFSNCMQRPAKPGEPMKALVNSFIRQTSDYRGCPEAQSRLARSCRKDRNVWIMSLRYPCSARGLTVQTQASFNSWARSDGCCGKSWPRGKGSQGR
jgi:hypothetical protein